jgi:hypothetical protein
MERGYTRAWRRAFARRLAIGRALQAGLFRPALATAGLRALNAVPSLGRLFVAATRDPA